MKTTRYTLLAAALLLAASCANDPVEDIINPSAPGTALPGGTFVIDYTAGMEGADTRLPANQRIQSLDYLIYQSKDGDYTLLKKRSIPDIGPNTPWPLTRDDMTWEQREALKDTLSTSHYYKMVFVVNANDTIWNTDDISGFHALQNVEEGSDFNDGRLVLPPRVFKEDDMYYMWSNSENPLNGNDYTDNKTASQKIVLKRMINKVEVKLDESYQTTEGLNTEIEKKINDFYDQITNTDTNNKGSIAIDIEEYIDTFSPNFYIPTGDIDKYWKAVEELKTYIVTDNAIQLLVKELKNTDFYTEYTTGIQSQLEKLCSWSDATHVQIEYENNPNPLDFNFNTQPNAQAKQPLYPIEFYEISSTEKRPYFVYYVFGNNKQEGTAEEIPQEVNQIQSFNFIKDENEVFAIEGSSLLINEYESGGNMHFIISCDPINLITASPEEKEKEVYINLVTTLSLANREWTFYLGGTFQDFIDSLNKNSGFNDGESMNNKSIKFKSPVIIISPKWDREEE